MLFLIRYAHFNKLYALQDLISYEAIGTTKINFRECAVGSGGICGSVFLDQSFQRYLMTYLGETYDELETHDLQRTMNDFEFYVKRQFTATEDKRYLVHLPGLGDIPDLDIRRGRLALSRYNSFVSEPCKRL